MGRVAATEAVRHNVCFREAASRKRSGRKPPHSVIRVERSRPKAGRLVSTLVAICEIGSNRHEGKPNANRRVYEKDELKPLFEDDFAFLPRLVKPFRRTWESISTTMMLKSGTAKRARLASSVRVFV